MVELTAPGDSRGRRKVYISNIRSFDIDVIFRIESRANKKNCQGVDSMASSLLDVQVDCSLRLRLTEDPSACNPDKTDAASSGSL